MSHFGEELNAALSGNSRKSAPAKAKPLHQSLTVRGGLAQAVLPLGTYIIMRRFEVDIEVAGLVAGAIYGIFQFVATVGIRRAVNQIWEGQPNEPV